MTEKLKLHLGSGYKRFDGYLNVDYDPLTKPDYSFDLEEGNWPFASNSVSDVIAHHVFEHLGDPGFFVVLKELYRVCESGCIIEVVVPHHRHDCFLNDPTHRRPITVEGMRLFSKAHNNYCIETGDGSSRLAHQFGVDFEVMEFKLNIDPFYHEQLSKIKPGSIEEKIFQKDLREKNNMIVDVLMKLVVIKDE
jgi:hypothetical protein